MLAMLVAGPDRLEIILPRLRDYPEGDRVALQLFGRGACYRPKCGEPMVKLDEGKWVINYDIAHIRGARETSARHDPNMTDAERKAFSNLILLCPTCHKRVDGTDREKFTPEILLEWKAKHESGVQSALAGLTRLTEDDLQDIIIEAVSEKQSQIMETLARLEDSDSEAAAVMRELIDELDQLRQYSSFLDLDAADSLYSASIRLEHMSATADALTSAADRLEGLPDTVVALRQVVDRLGGMEGNWQ